MRWLYRTILFEFHKDGLLGDRYIDDEEVEKILNEHGASGWELVNVTSVREGLMAICKKTEFRKNHGEAERRSEPEPPREISPEEPDESEGVTAEELQHREREYIRRLGEERQAARRRQEEDSVGEIKIR